LTTVDGIVVFLAVLGYRCNIRYGTVQVLWPIPPADWPAGPCRRQPAVSVGVPYQPQCGGRIRRCAASHAVLCKGLVRDLHDWES